MHRSLIVARFDPRDSEAVAEIFAESDRTELPHLLGASSRTLFRFHGLYLHLIEAEHEIGQGVNEMREHPLFADIDKRLRGYIRPYAPNWKSPADALATPFYTWEG
ncbi:TcmI family type II polyketide cyclase [Amycolatopsis vastitatis]|jgi:cyclase|uniref:TcmI family type II polyketide cyclase n=1 Tax=Amycolatopsis vastitatis TaxID=1905142 RepID=A0A229TFT1_9PSEU|nr:TcmI family type II polyketide cyclase [Amycolatopsis vastitatis]OXM69774.1 TcmI family type II polyketide cyclase [Amycolatopsis vastitatis]